MIAGSLRPPELDLDALSPRQREIYDAIANGPRGIVEGPLRVWLQSAGLAETAQALGVHCRYGSSLPPRLSELAILLTGAYFRSGFEWAIHSPIGLDAGLTAAQVEAIRTGQRPEFQDDEARLVHDIAFAMLHQHRIPDDLYAAGLEGLGQVALVDLIGVLGYYTLISLTINAFEVPPPNGVAEPFADLNVAR
jgi:4-carboxymuconolactone decarboxylase